LLISVALTIIIINSTIKFGRKNDTDHYD